MDVNRWVFSALLGAAVLLPQLGAIRAAEKSAPEAKPAAGVAAVFPMQDLSIFDLPDEMQHIVAQAAGGVVGTSGSSQPDKDVKAYPKLRSKQPLYGSVSLGQDRRQPSKGKAYHFVLDESGAAEKPKAVKPDESKPKEEKAAQKPQYDRLHFDANGDLDLTNDPVVSLHEGGLGSLRGLVGQVSTKIFDSVSVPLAAGAPAGKGRMQYLPIWMDQGEYKFMAFLPWTGRKGKVRLGKESFDAILMPSVSGRFDDKTSPLHLIPVEGPKGDLGWTMPTLGSLREAGGQYYTISASPGGDQLTVAPYQGDTGVLVVKSGGKDLKRLGAVGILQTQEMMLPLGRFTYPAPEPKQTKFALPVGDYRVMILSVAYGNLTVGLRSAMDASARGLSPGKARVPVNSIVIRKDKPYVIEFSGKPEIQFMSPAEDARLKPGNQVRVAAMVVDPALRMMITDLEDTTKETGKIQYKDPSGKTVSVPRYASLNPSVVISDSKGKKVAEGEMPFG